MNWEELLQHRQSKVEVTQWAMLVKEDAKEFKKLEDILFKDQGLASERAAWIFATLSDIDKNALNSMVNRLCKEVEKLKGPGTMRFATRTLAMITIPEKYHGKILDYCFERLNDTQTLIASRVNCMEALKNMAILYPDIKEELRSSIEAHLPGAQASYIARAKYVLKKLAKLK